MAASAFVRTPRHRFVGDSRSSSSLTVAAALLSIAENLRRTLLRSFQHLLRRKRKVLTAALCHARETLPLTSQGHDARHVDIFDGIDEDYLVPTKAVTDPHWSFRHCPSPCAWVARHLRENGAMIASGILGRYAGVFATDIVKQCPCLAAQAHASDSTERRGGC